MRGWRFSFWLIARGVRVTLLLALIAGSWAGTDDNVAQRGAAALPEIKRRALADLANVPNYVCVDTIERSVWVPAAREFRRLDRIHLELAHIGGADRFAWLGNSSFESKSPTAMVGYGVSFRGDFAQNWALVLANDATAIWFEGESSVESHAAWLYRYEVLRGGLAIRDGDRSGTAKVRGEFWVDPETLQLLAIEVQGYDLPDDLGLRSVADRTTYWQARIGKRTAPIARDSVLLVTTRDGGVKRNVSVFSGCREYTTESTVSFGDNAQADRPAVAEEARVAPGVQLRLALDRPLDADQATIGDEIRARVVRAAEDVRGAAVFGRVTRVIDYDDQIPLPRAGRRARASRRPVWGQHAGEVLIGIEFSEIEYRGKRVPFTARLIDVQSAPGEKDARIRGFGYFEEDRIVQYDPPGAASLYVTRDKPVLGRGVTMEWVTLGRDGNRTVNSGSPLR